MSTHSETINEPSDELQVQAKRSSESRVEEQPDDARASKPTHASDEVKESEETDSSSRRQNSLAINLGHRIVRYRFGLPTIVMLFLAVFVAGTYFAWWRILPMVVEWSNISSWRWAIGWLGVFFTVFAPVYIIMFLGPIVTAALSADDERGEERALDELDCLEQEIRGSGEPVDFARYSRKALKAYYHMGQSQVRVSFYIGVGAMIFGFLFLLSGLLIQVLDLSALPYIRANPVVDNVALGGGLIIEFIAATFLWIYRASIVQLNRYYRRQMLVHSSLLSVAIADKLKGGERGAAMASIIKTLIAPDVEPVFPGLPRRRNLKASSETDAAAGGSPNEG